jgi:uncharacterized membrane protein
MDQMHLAVLVLRFPLAVLLVVILPGYTLSCWLFPRTVLGGAERALLTLTTSIAVSSLVGFSLLRLFGTLKPAAFVFATVCLTLLFGTGALLRASRFSAARSRLAATLGPSVRWSLRLQRPYLPLILVSVCVALALIALLFSLSSDSGSAITEFFFAPQFVDRLSGTTPPQRGSTLDVPLSIVNHDSRPHSYRVEAWADGQCQLEGLPLVSVPAGATHQQVVSLPLVGCGSVAFIDFDLFSAGGLEPLANLRLWLAPGSEQ